MPQHILYSFRRCPYAMRARLALAYSQIPLELREVVLKNKPASLLAASPKATVPVLIRSDGVIIAESIDIMQWALQHNDPDDWLRADNMHEKNTIEQLIRDNDDHFKYWLDRYKYADRYPEHEPLFYRQQAECFVIKLEQRLAHSRYLIDDAISWADTAIMPFVRQFAHVDNDWFNSCPYPRLHYWLSEQLNSELFSSIMEKYPAWHEGDKPTPWPP